MNTRQLGKSGPMVSAIGLGCMSMSEFYGARNEDASRACLDRALELGVTFLDTADIYGIGHNEEFIGQWLKGRRDRVCLATKFGILRSSDGAFLGVNGTPEYVRSACEASLQRLGVDVIDVYYQHRVDQNTPIEETVGAIADLVREGKVRYLGLSEAGAETIRRTCATHPIAALQTEYSLWSRDPEDLILPTCRELGVAFVAYSPLGRGFLTHRITSEQELQPDDWRRNAPRFQGENLRRNLALVDRLEEVAGEKGCTVTQLALAWVLAQGEDVIPIPGTTRRIHLEENVKALDVHLTDDELARVNEAAPPGIAAGTRYPEVMMGLVDL